MHWRFFVRPRWLAGHAVIVVMVTVMVLLSHWQYVRLQETKRENALTSAALRSEPVAVTSAAQLADLPADRRVRLVGGFDSTRTVYLRYPTLDGLQGYYRLMPFRLENGDTVIVNTGWLPQTLGIDDALPGASTAVGVTVTGITQRDDRTSQSTLATRGAPAIPTVTAVDPAALAPLVGESVPATYVQLQTPAPEEPVRVLPLPEVSEGSHWSYTLQWAAFALLTLIGYALLLRRAYKDEYPPSHELSGRGCP